MNPEMQKEQVKGVIRQFMMMANQGNQQAQMNMNQLVRSFLAGEYQGVLNNPDLSNFGCSFGYTNNYLWHVTMLGPQKTPYEGGLYHINIEFPMDYPLHGPEFIFKEKIYHCNVNWSNAQSKDKMGHVCLSTINEWRSTGHVTDKNHNIIKYGVAEALIDIFSLFHSQGIKSPYSQDMAEEYINNREAFEQKAREWTQQYATSQ